MDDMQLIKYNHKLEKEAESGRISPLELMLNSVPNIQKVQINEEIISYSILLKDLDSDFDGQKAEDVKMCIDLVYNKESGRTDVNFGASIPIPIGFMYPNLISRTYNDPRKNEKKNTPEMVENVNALLQGCIKEITDMYNTVWSKANR